VCDGGELGCSSRRARRRIDSMLGEIRQRNAPKSPRPFGLKPKRAPALSQGLPISTYWLRLASRIHPVLVATHHVRGREIGSNILRRANPIFIGFFTTIATIPSRRHNDATLAVASGRYDVAMRSKRSPGQITFQTFREFRVFPCVSVANLESGSSKRA